MTVFDSLKKVTGVRYNNAQYNRDILKTYMMRLARERGVRLPSEVDPERINYFGAYVFPPHAGLSEHVVYADLASLYPNIARAINISPETIIGSEANFMSSEYSEDEVVWSYYDTREVKWLDEGESWQQYTDGKYKMIYSPSQNKVRWADDPQYQKCYFVHPDVETGLVTEGVQDLIDMKYDFEGAKYGAVKRVVNSLYGYMSFGTQYNASRIYDWRLGEATTLAGRKVIKHTADRLEARLTERGYPDAEIVGGDTDSCVVSLPSADSWDDCMDDVLGVVEALNSEDYPEFMHSEFGVPRDSHYMEVEAESYARRLFVPAENPSSNDDVGSKKRYSQWVQWDDDTPLDETIDEVEHTGWELVRSDTSDATTDVQKRVLELLVRQGTDARSEIFEYLQDVHEDARNGRMDASYLARRRAVSKDLSEYGSPNRTPHPVVRGAKWANEQLGTEIGEGDKPKYYPVTSVGGYRSTYRAKTAEDGDVVDYISLPQSHDVADYDVSVDYDALTTESIEGPLRPILRTCGWQWSDVRSNTVDSTITEFM